MFARRFRHRLLASSSEIRLTVGNLELPSTPKPVLFWNQMGLAYLVKKS